MTTLLHKAENDLRAELGHADLHALEETDDLHEELRTSVQEYCRRARESGLPPEQVIRQLKSIIADHFGPRLVRKGLTAKDLVWHAVRRCVHSYFQT